MAQKKKDREEKFRSTLSTIQTNRISSPSDESLSKTITELKSITEQLLHSPLVEESGLASSRLAWLLLQTGSYEEANTYLQDLGYSYCFTEQLCRHSSATSQEVLVFDGSSDKLVHVWDNALPLSLFSQTCAAFSPSSPFWEEHDYPCGYFSYAHRLNDELSTMNNTLMSCLSKQVMDIIIPAFPEVENAKVVEWWAHNRPHSDGHQLHFDSDNEGCDGVRNPIVSTILYLTGTTLGGPTLVTTQETTSTKLPEKGWLCYPSSNRLSVFKGDLLHCVIPGIGPNPDPNVKRITLMFAFWPELKTRVVEEGVDLPCASMGFPDMKVSKFTWPLLMKGGDEKAIGGGSSSSGSSGSSGERNTVATPVSIPSVSPIWRDVDLEVNKEKGIDLESVVKKGGNLPGYYDFFQFA